MTRTVLAIVCLCASVANAQLSSFGFTYQGMLKSNGVPVSTAHDFQFTLWNDPIAGTQVSGLLCAEDVVPVDGRFTVRLDFGLSFDTDPLYLQIEVREDAGTPCSNFNGYTTLTSRQELTAAPFAIRAHSADIALQAVGLDGQPPSYYTDASNLSAGTIPDERLSNFVVRTDQPATFHAPVFFTNANSMFVGDGAQLTGLSAANITDGVLSLNRLPNAVALTNVDNVFAGNQRMSGSLRINTASTPLAPLHVAGEGYFAQAVRVGPTTTAPKPGTIRFNSSSRDFEGYNGVWWRSFTTGNVTTPETAHDFASAGTTSWTVPAGIYSIGIEVWGGGGGGGGPGSSFTNACGMTYPAGGGGGGSGAYGFSIVDVNPGDVIDITVGQAGVGGGAGTAGTGGGFSSAAIRGGSEVAFAAGGGGGSAGLMQTVGPEIQCTTPTTPGGSGGSSVTSTFATVFGNPGTMGYKAYNAGTCPSTPNFRAGCVGSGGAAIVGVSPLGGTWGYGSSGGGYFISTGILFNGGSGGTGRVRIMY